MRAQRRPDAPEAFAENQKRWNSRWVEALGKNPGARFRWYRARSKSARDWALPVLREMTQGHCAFCDCYPLEDRSGEPVEHFIPKSMFPGEAFSWDNLYYSCELCQGTKGGQWDDALLRPDAADYLFGRYFEFDFTTGAIRPSAGATAGDSLRATATIRLYGLDLAQRRRFRLVELWRWSRSGSGKLVDLTDCAYRDFLELAP